ncbi:SLAP domain-containing protein [Fictibacillus aquaticus]|nr:SLAP domain-containing protein [Fictibacillus aquaticus]
MQKLLFEPAWDKALASQDREYIKKIFEETKDAAPEDAISSAVLRKAVNHKGERLVTVLIHNRSSEEEVFHDRTVELQKEDGSSEEKAFTLPIAVPPYTSMPWTFIFPAKEAEEDFVTQNIKLIS